MHQIQKLKCFPSLAVVFALIHSSQMLSRELDDEYVVGAAPTGMCSNYIWVINNVIAYYGAPYIRG